MSKRTFERAINIKLVEGYAAFIPFVDLFCQPLLLRPFQRLSIKSGGKKIVFSTTDASRIKLKPYRRKKKKKSFKIFCLKDLSSHFLGSISPKKMK